MKKHGTWILTILMILSLKTVAEPAFDWPVGKEGESPVTYENYQQVIQDLIAQNIYAVIAQYGKPVVINDQWDTNYFGAGSLQREGFFDIMLTGGYARSPGNSVQILALTVCHEMGHILGGEPRQSSQVAGSEWASAEGQADFYAASVCLPLYFKNHPEQIPAADESVKKICGGNNICEAIAQTGEMYIHFAGTYFPDLKGDVDPQIETPAPPAAELIRDSYPSFQCRLDTFVTGALCQSGVVAGDCKAPRCWNP
jgi:hypothetical protein